MIGVPLVVVRRDGAMGSELHACAGALLIRAGRLLLCHRSPDRDWFPNVWDIPGGHIEDGEQSADTIARELADGAYRPLLSRALTESSATADQ